MRYLLDQEPDASAPDEFALSAWVSTHDEEVALLLLEAGWDFALMDDDGLQFLRYGKDNHWGRVVGSLR